MEIEDAYRKCEEELGKEQEDRFEIENLTAPLLFLCILAGKEMVEHEIRLTHHDSMPYGMVD